MSTKTAIIVFIVLAIVVTSVVVYASLKLVRFVWSVLTATRREVDDPVRYTYRY